MINEIKKIIENYINNAKLTCIVNGTVVSGGGVKISDKVTIPSSMIVGNLKNSLIINDKVRLLRDHGGKLYFVLEVVTG